jgi:2-keto-4-pentenoate hydratase
VAGDQADTVRTAARLLAAVGERLEAGDRILAGGLTHVPVQPGDRVSAAIEGLGEVQLEVMA